ncbi:MAG: family tricarboxylate transporter, receptor protein [Xanthobacteraceae bacterium]|nr:family tricarboxylate transporter, receptor protein [Xanthobacteraceae bacterium]
MWSCYAANLNLIAPQSEHVRARRRSSRSSTGRHLNEAVKSESFRKRIAPLGITAPEGANTPQDFAAFLTKENARQAEMAKLSGHARLEAAK